MATQIAEHSFTERPRYIRKPSTVLPESMADLANIIQESTAVVNQYLAAHQLPRPSFDANGPSTFPVPPSAEEIQNARSTIISATQALQDLVVGPAGILENIHANDVMCLQAIYRYNVAAAFRPDEQVTFDELAEAVGLNVVDLKRIVRLAMTRRVFCEPRPGLVAHTAASRLLREDARAHAFAGIMTEERFPASAKTVDALEQYGRSRAPEQSGFSLANGTDCGLYEELEKHPERRHRWTLAMSAMAKRINFEFILGSFPWHAYAQGTVVDVGGGDGAVSIGLAERVRNPHLRFVVQDRAETLATVETPAHLRGRVEFEAHDFFAPQPRAHADVYYFRNIFHNWPDEQCIQILRNHVPVMRPGARLVIDDFALHDPLTVPPWEERRNRSMDITMLAYFGSRERTISEWMEMIQTAHPRFELKRATRDAKQPNTILEVGWRNKWDEPML